jgi:predicted RNA-binding protein with PUA-like domain
MAASKRQYWLVKQEPETYSWDAFVADKTTAWTGVRSYPARLALRGMNVGDSVLYYHSGDAKEVVGIAEVTKAPYADPTMEKDEKDWTAVDLKAVKRLKNPVPLAAIRNEAGLAQIALVRQTRLSVMPLTQAEYDFIVKMSSA